MSGLRDTGSTSGSISPIQAALLQGTGQVNARILLRAALIHIGRGVSGDFDITIAPDDTQVSREHARLILEAGRWLLEDCSRNGTLVNGELVHHQRVVLRAGDRIQIGRTFDYTFRDLNATDDVAVSDATSGSGVVATAHETPPSKVGIWISPSAAVWRDGVALSANLSRTEYRLLKYLARRPGDVCDYDSTIQAVWGVMRDKDSLHELIYRVRRKIESDPTSPRYLIIRAGIGVVFFPQGSNGGATE
ncbi:MAG: FHA domain-containing protein [Chloroflexi bacterium]|nr:FHA domain-containing protein [Chloroflexota bacterium]